MSASPPTVSPPTSCLQDLGWPSVFVIYGSLGLFWNLAWQKLVADYPPLAALSKTQAAATAVQQQAPVVQQQQQQDGSVAPTTVQQQQVQQQAVGRSGLPPLPRVRDLPWKEFFTNKAFLAIVMAHSAFGEQQARGRLAVSWHQPPCSSSSSSSGYAGSGLCNVACTTGMPHA